MLRVGDNKGNTVCVSSTKDRKGRSNEEEYNTKHATEQGLVEIGGRQGRPMLLA